MSTTTPNLGLVKPELTDVADITAMNPNWDKIDEELGDISQKVEESLGDISPEDIGAVNKAGDVMSGSLTVMDNFNVNKTFDDVEYKTYIRPINYSILGNGDYSTGLIHYNDGVNHAQLMFNKDGVMLRDNVNGKAYQIYGQHNIDLLKTLFLPLNGGIMTGNLDFKKVDNGSGTVYKNHSATADFGMVFRDVDSDGNYNQILMCAKENTLKYRDTTGKTSVLFGGHNTDALASTIKDLIDSGVIEVGGFKSPIKMTNALISKSSKFTGTGQGKLYVAPMLTDSESRRPSVTIDGVSLGEVINNNRTSSTQFVDHVEFEFTESFTVVAGSDSSYSSCVCWAVFY